MKIIIDTCSLLSLVRYYLPFDNNGTLYDYLKSKLECGELIIIDKVLDECKYVSKGIVLTKLPILKDTEFLKLINQPVKTVELLPPEPKRFYHLLNNDFAYQTMKKKLNDAEFEIKKQEALRDADFRQILLALTLIKSGDDVVLVTEESEGNNDSKLFKKIPLLCKSLDLNTMTLPEYLSKCNGIDINIKLSDSHQTEPGAENDD